MDQFPTMLYRHPSVARDAASLQDGFYDTAIAKDAAERDALLADGFHDTAAEARAVSDAAAAAAAAKVKADAEAAELERARQVLAAAEGSAPTRAELEQKATELGIKFDGRTSDKKLADLIKATLES